jgi:hypothetical protein
MIKWEADIAKKAEEIMIDIKESRISNADAFAKFKITHLPVPAKTLKNMSSTDLRVVERRIFDVLIKIGTKIIAAPANEYFEVLSTLMGNSDDKEKGKNNTPH